MTDSIQCPVCGYAHVPQDMETCPQCDSDLTCFRLLESLSDARLKEVPEPQGNAKADNISTNPDTPDEKRIVHHKNPVLQPRTEQRLGRWALIVLTIVLVWFFIFTVYRFSVVEHMMQQHKTGLADLGASLENNTLKKEQIFEITKEKEIALAKDVALKQDLSLKQDIESLGIILRENGTRLNRIESTLSQILSARLTDPLQASAREEPCFKIYHATDQDTLWNIARDLYGSGFLYPVLLVHNPGLHIYTISKKDQLRYFCDTSLAKELYTQIIGKNKDRFYWKYTVQPKDTRAAVMERYCRDQRDCLVDGIFREPGKTIGIYLE